MPDTEIKAAQANYLPVRLTSTASRPQPQWGVRWNDLTVAYRASGGLVLTTRSVGASEWTELGCGLYLLYFTTAQHATAGDFVYIITSRPTPYATFDDYPGNVNLPENVVPTDQSDLIISLINNSTVNLTGQVNNVLYFLGLQGTPQNATLSADLLKLIRGMYGRIRWDFTTNPWTISVYAEDNTTLVASFTYENADEYEDRVRA